ncbi:RNA-binding protein 28 [Taenia crassiceps]|uniref:RNA-binding protein 28 n=1 Tax=Taenia crassiceps TaxID=6207 RepID=A0ABR4Q3K1_9CEST
MGRKSGSSAALVGNKEDQRTPNEFFISKNPRKSIDSQTNENDLTVTSVSMSDGDDIKECLADIRHPGTKQRQNVRNQLNVRPSDTAEGRTIFIRNVSFDADEDSLHQFLANFGKLIFVKIVKDKLTQHPRGTAFAKFESKADAESILLQASKPENAHRFVYAGRLLTLSLAVSREEALKIKELRSGEEVSCHGNAGGRNLHLARIGLIRPGSRAAEEMTYKEAAMREAVARAKEAKLRNPSIFISPLRLCVRNIPLNVDDRILRQACQKIAGPSSRITECRVMRDLKSGVEHSKSLGYAFVAFEEHGDALKALHALNNNSTILGGNRKPIVEFSLENSKALERKRRRAEKSLMARESKLSGSDSQPTRRPVGVKKAKPSRQLRVKAKGGKKAPMRIMPKKLGPKIRRNRPKKGKQV